MSELNSNSKLNELSLKFENENLEAEFLSSYDKGIREPLKLGIIISILSWYGGIGLIYFVIPETFVWFGSLTFLYISSCFIFIIYATYKKQFEGKYHLLGAISNAWAGLFAVYYCDQFPNGEHLILPVLIFIIFFGLYMIRLRWLAAFIAALSYTLVYSVYIIDTDLTSGQIILYVFVIWMTLIFALLAGRGTEKNVRIDFIQKKTIKQQSEIIEKEKNLLLKEVHHRVKNNLQIIVSLIKLQNSKENSAEVARALRDVQERVVSMSLVHQKMHQASNYVEISVKDYVHQLVENVQGEYRLNEVDIELEIANDIYVDMEFAVPFGLIINEIMTNFFKHSGCSSNEKKSCLLEVEKKSGNTLSISYKDNGKGFPVSLQIINERTIGLELIDLLVEQLNGSFKFSNQDGAVYKIQLNLE